MNCLIVPTIALDVSLLERVARSVDFPIKHKVVINGGRPDALDSWSVRHPDWAVLHYGKNLGFAGSVNKSPELFPEDDAFLLMNDDGEFQPGCLERVCKISDEQSKDCHIIYVNEHQAFDICVWTRRGIIDFGLFDENFYPAYFEDWEMRARYKLGDFRSHIIEGPFPVKHGKPRPCGDKYHRFMDALKPLNEDYLLRKWGVVGDVPAFSNPFNDPSQKINEWKIESENRLKRESICAEFWNQPNPSLYE
jgi:hypothetical protein